VVAGCAVILYVCTMPDGKRTAHLDWEDVRYFVALARHGTLSATARNLRVNHATVARRVTSLETRLGRALFDRRADGYALTAEGKAVFDEASAMDEAALSVLRRLDADTQLSGLVRVTAARPRGSRVSLAIGGLHSAPTARRRKLRPDARATALHCFRDTWPLMIQAWWRYPLENVCRNATCGS
jgi:DNA-binding transcriptional LysR family regulator